MTAEPGLVSVIIPAFNAERHLTEAVDSALKQTYQPIEVIVVNDGSVDGTESVALSFGDRITYVSQENGGISAARNRGIEMARGAFFAFLDADDTWNERKLALQMAALEDDPQLDMVFCHMFQFRDGAVTQEINSQPAPLPSCMLISRASFFRVGCFDPNVKHGEFIPWYSRARELGMRERILKETLLNRRIHDDNIGVREQHNMKNYVRLLKESIDRRRANKS